MFFWTVIIFSKIRLDSSIVLENSDIPFQKHMGVALYTSVLKMNKPDKFSATAIKQSF